MNSNNALIQLINGEIPRHGQPLCSARDLHAFLEVGKDFSNRVKDRIRQHGFVEGRDFIILAKIGENPQGGRPAKEYRLTIRAGKSRFFKAPKHESRKPRSGPVQPHSH